MVAARSLRLLWVLPYLPWPTTSGGKLRQYHLLRCMAERGHRITLLVQSKVPLDAATRAQLAPWVERLIVLPRRPLRSLSTLWHGLLAPVPLLATVNGYSRALATTLDGLLQQPWDVVQIEHSYTFQSCEAVLRRRRQPFVLTEHNVESTLAEVTYARLPVPLRALAGRDRQRYQRWERRVMAQARKVVALTEADAAVLAPLSPHRVAVVVNGTDSRAFASVQADSAARRLLFVGNFEYAPNVDAVEWLLESIMPLIWRQAPDVRLCLCGYALPDMWPARWPDARIEWRGFVENLQQVQAASSLFIAALRDGGGSKLKVLEAMAAGLPLVATPQAVSGLQVGDGIHYAGGQDAAGLAQAALALLAQPAHAAALGEAGRGYVQQHHDWAYSADQLEAVYAEVAACA